VSVTAPRWEWRRFGHLGDADGDADRDGETIFGQQTPERVQESDELYLLSAGGTDAVKVRDGLMDVKHLIEVDHDGLEKWTPVLKAGFPLSAADVGVVLLALREDAPSGLARTTYSLRQLLEDVVRPHPGLLGVEVHKRRQRYTFGGCLAELTEVRTEQGSTRTVVVESEDAARVTASLRALGMASRPNVSFVRGLKALVGFGSERYAVIDVGTNSVKFHIGERSPDQAWRKVVDRAEVTRLGQGLQETGRLGAEPIRRTVAAVAGMVEEARQHRVAEIAAVGTAGLRIAANAPDFVTAVLARSGVSVEIISAEEEGRLAYLGASAGIAGRVRHGRWELAVLVRARRPRPGAVQRQRGRGSLHGATWPRRRGLRGGAGRGPELHRGRPRPSRRPNGTRSARRHGRRCHEPRCGPARPGRVRPRRRAGNRARPHRDRPADRALPHAQRRRTTDGRRPPACASRHHPRGRLHHPHGALQARAGLAHGQRPRTATWRHDGEVRRGGKRTDDPRRPRTRTLRVVRRRPHGSMFGPPRRWLG
jgi:hypothetical protein